MEKHKEAILTEMEKEEYDKAIKALEVKAKKKEAVFQNLDKMID